MIRVLQLPITGGQTVARRAVLWTVLADVVFRSLKYILHCQSLVSGTYRFLEF